MTQKAYKKGSACPSLAQGTLRIYSMRFCPYAQRTLMVLQHLNIPHEVVNVALSPELKPDWLFEKNPLGVTPVLEQDDKIIYESAICDEYLDAVYGKSKLHSSDPLENSRKKMLMARFEKLNSSFFPLIASSASEEAQKKAANEVVKTMLILEDELKGKYFGGSDIDILDFHFWPFIERFPMVQKVTGHDCLPADRFPKLTAWAETMKARPEVKATMRETMQHVEYLESNSKYRAGGGEGNFDVGLE